MQHYKLIDQQQNVPYNGFAAAVFEDLVTGKHIIAMRGMEVPKFPSQTWLDLIVADGSIGVHGFQSSYGSTNQQSSLSLFGNFSGRESSCAN